MNRFIKNGDNVIDYAPAMGYFSIPAANMSGNHGRIFCVDVHEKAFSVLNKRARKRKINNITTVNITQEHDFFDNHLESIDFILAFAVIHEVQEKDILFRNFYRTLKENGKVLICEPKNMANNDILPI